MLMTLKTRQHSLWKSLLDLYGVCVVSPGSDETDCDLVYFSCTCDCISVKDISVGLTGEITDYYVKLW